MRKGRVIRKEPSSPERKPYNDLHGQEDDLHGINIKKAAF